MTRFLSRLASWELIDLTFGNFCQIHFLSPQQAGTNILGRETEDLTDVGKGKWPIAILFHDPVFGFEILARSHFVAPKHIPGYSKLLPSGPLT